MDPIFVPDLSVVTPAYDPNGRVHDVVYAIKDHLVSRGSRAEVLVVSGESIPDLPGKRICIHDGLVSETMEATPGRPGPAPLARAILATLADRVLLIDAPPPVPVEEMDRLLEYLDKGRDVVVARPEGGEESGRERGLCFSAYRGAVARRIAALHGAQDFGCGDEHLFLVSDPDLDVCEVRVPRRDTVDRLPCSFGGALRQFREAHLRGSRGPIVPTPDAA
jgi:hypothetical protein